MLVLHFIAEVEDVESALHGTGKGRRNMKKKERKKNQYVYAWSIVGVRCESASLYRNLGKRQNLGKISGKPIRHRNRWLKG